MRALWFQLRRPLAWIASIAWAVLFFAFIAQPAGALIQANVQELAKKKGWDQLLVVLSEKPVNEYLAFVHSNWFWGLFGFLFGSGIILWASIALQPQTKRSKTLPSDTHSQENPNPGFKFLAPVARWAKPTETAWCIPVLVTAPIKQAEAWYYGHNMPSTGSGHPLRWILDAAKSIDAANTTLQMDLSPDQHAYVGVVYRDEQDAYAHAFVLENRIITEGGATEVIAEGQVRRFFIEIRWPNGNKIRSPWYSVNVPSEHSNAHFLCCFVDTSMDD